MSPVLQAGGGCAIEAGVPSPSRTAMLPCHMCKRSVHCPEFVLFATLCYTFGTLCFYRTFWYTLIRFLVYFHYTFSYTLVRFMVHFSYTFPTLFWYTFDPIQYTLITLFLHFDYTLVRFLVYFHYTFSYTLVRFLVHFWYTLVLVVHFCYTFL